MSIEQRDAAREKLGLDEPLLTQFTRWAAAAAGGSFGISYQYKRDAKDVAIGALYGTLSLTVTSFILIFIFGAAIAVFCVSREGGAADKITRKIGITLSSIPEFFAALLLILIFCVGLNILPASGAYSIGQAGNLMNRAIHLILPVSAIVITHVWYIAYTMRNKLSDESRKEYALMYRAKGLSKAAIYARCLRNIMPVSISAMAAFLPHLIGGAYVIETVFSFPGLGKLGFDSVMYHDYNMLMLVCIVTGAAVIFVNMVAQAVNELIDPRTKQEGGA